MPNATELLRSRFPHTPTPGQEALFEKLNRFILQTDKASAFLLRGYAGTGKTSVISAVVQVLRYYEYKTFLLAPTGRAAKVMSGYAHRRAFTIHKIIYRLVEDKQGGRMRYERQRNYYKNTVFIVDESSMLSDDQEYRRNGLLGDLLEYIFEDPYAGNKVIFVGDNAQLPPVGASESPALQAAYLEHQFGLQVTEHLLTEVVRQAQKSGILENATFIRDQIAAKRILVRFNTKPYRDIYRMTSDRLEDGLRYAYNKFGLDGTIIICRSNRSATQFNQYIRRSILFKEEEIDAGDHLMIVKNNYFWLKEDAPAGFLANGEFVEIMRINGYDEQYGFRFADLTLRLSDYPDHPAFEAKVHLGTLGSFTPALTDEESKRLMQAVRADAENIEDAEDRYIFVRDNPYLHALQVKFAYALTCHKAQGGQWEAVFVDMGYVTDEMMNMDFMRWVYTAITRASGELYLVNFKPEFFEVQA